MADIVNSFIGQLPARIHQFEEASKQDDPKALEILASRMKGEGSMYGFKTLTATAELLETSLVGNPLSPTRPKVGELVQLCMQIRSASISN